MKWKYAPLIGKPLGTPGRGKKSNPDKWITGPCVLTREKYYAYLKHRAQANHRGEEHSLSWETWQSLWNDDNWNCRGRGGDDLVLGRTNWSEGWHEHNVEIMTRRKHFNIRRSQIDRS
jgi:hypothetical protein